MKFTTKQPVWVCVSIPLIYAIDNKFPICFGQHLMPTPILWMFPNNSVHIMTKNTKIQNNKQESTEETS